MLDRTFLIYRIDIITGGVNCQMISIIYMLLCFIIGYYIVIKLFNNFFTSKVTTLLNTDFELPNFMIIIPSSFLIGTLLVTWMFYLLSLFLSHLTTPLFYANIIGFIVLFEIIAFLIIKKKFRFAKIDIKEFITKYKSEITFIAIVSIVWTFMFYRSFNIVDNKMNVGLTVFSDFGPHLSTIRSFSQGSNFPTQYPHFPAGNIRYHFMFQFLVGNLEFLGLRIDHAFNLMSIFSIVSFCMLLYSFVMILFNNKLAAVLTNILWFFRSSFAVFTFLKGTKTKEILPKIMSNTESIGLTQNENWGLWSQKVYLNQRHLAFSFAIMVMILILSYPLLKEAFIKISEYMKSKEYSLKQKLINIFKSNFFSKDAWLPNSLKDSIIIGIILGAISFWNGAVMIATVLILFIIALFSKHKLQYLIYVVIAGILSIFQSNLLIGHGEAPFKPEFFIGFLAKGATDIKFANQETILNIFRYYFELLGIVPLLALVCICFAPLGSRILGLAFVLPLIFATTVKLTPDIAVNHKYVMMSVTLLNIFIAYMLAKLYQSKLFIGKLLFFPIIALLISTGLIDLVTVYNLDRNPLVSDVKNDITAWTLSNTKPGDIFLTNYDSLNYFLLSGRKIYYGWPYYGWSAGYNTDARYAIFKQMYNDSDISDLKKLLSKNSISYVVIDNSVRENTDYKVNEDIFKNNFSVVFDNKMQNIQIYKVD